MYGLTLLALASGAPALVAQLAWTRELSLLAGSQIEAVSTVLVVFFGGLALGSRFWGPRADRAHSPLRLYAQLELSAGTLILLSPFALRWLGGNALAWLPADLLPLAGALLLLAPTMLLGGTLPALLRAATTDPIAAARLAGRLVGANTLGAVAGVGVAAACLPLLGLRNTLLIAGLASVTIGALAMLAASHIPDRPRPPREPAQVRASTPRRWLLAAAAAGVATIAFEVLATRAAALRLGSSLLAWAMTLGLFLLALGLGYAVAGRRAARSVDPASGLGWIELASASLLALAARALPSVDMPAAGSTLTTVLQVAFWTLPPVVLMGAAFPFFVRLGVRDGPHVGAGFGAISAANTAGGIAGSLLALFVALPWFGLAGAFLTCGVINAILAVLCLLAGRGTATRVCLQAIAALAVFVVVAVWAPGPAETSRFGSVIFVAHGRQATAAVLHVGARRDLIVDGDPEASTSGNARATEELLAVIPLLLHPEPRSLLEVGLGSGITLGSTTRFALQRIECVEIADAVIAAAPYFEPDNRGVATGDDERVRIVRGDGRAFLVRRPEEYDVVIANTVHPWSVGATGLYSREYFGRIAAALRPGGLAAQWLPVAQLGEEHLGAVLRTFFSVFEHGTIFWAAGSVIAVGSQDPWTMPQRWPVGLGNEARVLMSRLGLGEPRALRSRQVASARVVREVLGSGLILSDDLPALEVGAVIGRAAGPGARGELALIERLAEAGARENEAIAPLHMWLESRVIRARGEAARADLLLDLAERGGLEMARAERLDGEVASAAGAMSADRPSEAMARLRGVLVEEPGHRAARLALSAIHREQEDARAAIAELEILVETRPEDAESWNLLADALARQGSNQRALVAARRALLADPYFPQALANAGILAIRLGELALAEQMLRRLRAISPLGRSPYEQALDEAFSAASAKGPTAPGDGSRRPG